MKKTERIIRKRFPDENFQKVILFRNPNECNHLLLEKVNPTHKGIIWGRRKKSVNKGNSYIQIGRVIMATIPATYGLSVLAWLDMFTSYAYGLMAQMTVFGLLTGICVSLVYYASVFKMAKVKPVAN